MPIVPRRPVRRLSQAEFKELSFAVMDKVFEIHNDMGRFFDELIYKRELANCIPGTELEFPIVATHKSFSREYYLDALIGDGGAFEFKTARNLAPHHRGQLYNYLLLLDLAHGKLVNMRSESVEHEFVNATLRSADRHAFRLITDRWNPAMKGSELLYGLLVELLQDWGVGLELDMYESALTELLGGEEKVSRNVTVRHEGRILGQQRLRLIADDVAFRLTAFEASHEHFEEHARRLLQHVDLKAIAWVNLGLQRVTFTTVESGL